MIRFLWMLALRVFFRRIEAEGLENVPASGPVLLVPNHTNALVDPLVLQAVLRRPLTLTAKSTLARNPLLRIWLWTCDVILFHRRQDVSLGADPARNREGLAECRRRLAGGAAICIFPEGVSHSDPQVRPFLPGAARIALDYVEQDGNPGGLRIVPVGLHYEEKDRFRSSVWVRFGAPVDAAAWRSPQQTLRDAAGQASQQNPGATASEIAVLTAELEARVRALTLNFERRREAYVLGWAAELLATGGEEPPPLGRDRATLAARVSLVERLQEGYLRLAESRAAEVEALETRVRAYRSELRRLGIAPAEVYLPMHAGRAAFFVVREAELLLAGLPLAAWGLVHHAVPYAAVRAVARKLSVDRDHWASNAVFPGLAAFPMWYALVLAAAFLSLPLPVALAYAAALPYCGWYALQYRDRAGGAWQRTRTFVRFLLDPALQRRLMDKGRAIIGDIRRLGETDAA